MRHQATNSAQRIPNRTIFKELKKISANLEFYVQWKLSFKNEGDTKTFSDKQKQNTSVTWTARNENKKSFGQKKKEGSEKSYLQFTLMAPKRHDQYMQQGLLGGGLYKKKETMYELRKSE